MTPRPAAVYRMYDADEVLLYVGRSVQVLQRIGQHSDKTWFTDVDIVTVEHFDSVHEATIAEAKAIGSEGPRYNGRNNTAPKTEPPKLVPIQPERRNTTAQRLWLVQYGETTVEVWAAAAENAIRRVQRGLTNRYATPEEVNIWPVVVDEPMSARLADGSDVITEPEAASA